MTTEDLARYPVEDLRRWAEAHPAMPQAAWALRLLADVRHLQQMVGGLAERVYRQSELLSRKGERVDMGGGVG